MTSGEQTTNINLQVKLRYEVSTVVLLLDGLALDTKTSRSFKTLWTAHPQT